MCLEHSERNDSEMSLKGKKFVASFSGGKDSTLAIYRAIMNGMIPVEFIITYNIDKERSWFHGIPETLLNTIEESVGVPIRLIKTTGAEYEANFEKALQSAKERGAEICVFGDIDLDGHLTWCKDRCKAVAIEAFFPLWHESRKSIVHEFIDSGFKAAITIVDTNRMPDSFLGKTLSRNVTMDIEKSGADICGENGEYHTFVYGGPLFKNEIKFEFGEKVYQDNYGILPVCSVK